MKKELLVIINPISGTGKQKGIDSKINDILDKSKFNIEIIKTEYAGHASEIAEKAIEEKKDIIAVIGGDGTVNEVAKMLVNSNVAMAIVPCGSGNGLARHLGISMHPLKALEQINKFEAREIDCIDINGEKCFNVAGVGFDALVSYQFANMNSRGFFSYLKSVLGSYFSYKNQEYTIETETKTVKEKAFLFSIANSCQYGNNAYINPQAKIDDGKCEIVSLKKPSLLTLPIVGIRFLNKTLHKSSYCNIYSGSNFKIHQGDEISHIDGEPLKLSKDLEIKVLAKSLKVYIDSKIKI